MRYFNLALSIPLSVCWYRYIWSVSIVKGLPRIYVHVYLRRDNRILYPGNSVLRGTYAKMKFLSLGHSSFDTADILLGCKIFEKYSILSTEISPKYIKVR